MWIKGGEGGEVGVLCGLREGCQRGMGRVKGEGLQT